MKKSSIIVTLTLALAAFAAHAQFLEMNTSADCNQNLQTFADGVDYPLGGTPIDAGGVPFSLSLSGNLSGTTGIVQTLANDRTTLAVVPEPSALLLIGLGALVLGARLTRHNDSWD